MDAIRRTDRPSSIDANVTYTHEPRKTTYYAMLQSSYTLQLHLSLSLSLKNN